MMIPDARGRERMFSQKRSRNKNFLERENLKNEQPKENTLNNEEFLGKTRKRNKLRIIKGEHAKNHEFLGYGQNKQATIKVEVLLKERKGGRSGILTLACR